MNKRERALYVALLVGVLCAVLVIGAWAAPRAQIVPPSKFTYQGHLMQSNGYPAPDGVYIMEFRLYDAAIGGNMLWGPETKNVAVDDGYFSVVLGNDIPVTANDLTSNTYLEVTVSGETMSPRHLLTSVPFALSAGSVLSGAVSWSDITGIPAGFADGVDDEGASSDLVCPDGQVPVFSSGALVCQKSKIVLGYDNLVDSSSGLVAGVSNSVADSCSNCVVIGRLSSAAGGVGQVVLGTNSATAGNYSMALGKDNSAVADYSISAGGYQNGAIGTYSGILGGADNTANGNYAISLGGYANHARADYSAVLAGAENTAWGQYSLAMGSGAVATATGEIAMASGYFSEHGDAQVEQYVLRRYVASPQTFTAYKLYADGISEQIKVYDNEAIYFDVLGVAKAEDADDCLFGAAIRGMAYTPPGENVPAQYFETQNLFSEGTCAVGFLIQTDTEYRITAGIETGDVAPPALRAVAVIRIVRVRW